MSDRLTLVAPGIWQLDAPFMGVPLMLYLIDGGTKLALVDSGIDTTPEAHILPAIEAFGRRPDILINTHGHVDHFGGNARLKAEWPDLRIAAHEIDARWIEDTRRHLHEFYMPMPEDWCFDDGGAALLALCGGNSAVDHRLTDGETLQVGTRRFVVHSSAGHSPGHVTLFERDTGVAISGDVALGWGPPTNEDAPEAPAVFTDADAYLAGARMALNLGASLYCTGHFGAISRERMSAIVDDTDDFVASFDRWSLEALAGNTPRTLHGVAAFVGNQIPTYEFGFHIHASTLAVLERHARHGRVRTRVVAGRRVFVLAEGARHG